MTEQALKTHTLGALLSLDIPSREPLLGSWLVARHQSMLFAPTGLGKSLLAMSIALAVAGGGKVFGWRSPDRRRVLIVDGEMDLADLKERAGLLMNAVDDLDREAALVNLCMLARHGQGVNTDFPDLADEAAGHAGLLAVIDRFKPALVVLDNFSTLADVRDENEAGSFNPIISLLNKLRDRDCATILVHHSRKSVGVSGGNFRGSSKIAATFESIVELRRREDLGPEETGFELRWEKFRSNPQHRGGPFKAQLTTTGDGLCRWKVEAVEHQELHELVKAWRSTDHLSQNDLAAALGISKGEVSKRKRAAFRAGMISEREWEECGRAAREIAEDASP